MENPARYMTKNAPISDTGITIHGTSVTRQSRKEKEDDDDNQNEGYVYGLLLPH